VRAGVAAETVKRFEFWGSDPKLATVKKLATVNKWRRAIEAAGVDFIDSDQKSFEGGPGVRLRVGAKLPAEKKKR
jgi:hypothetical protein